MFERILIAKVNWGDFYQGEELVPRFPDPEDVGRDYERFNFRRATADGRFYGSIPKSAPMVTDKWLVVFIARDQDGSYRQSAGMKMPHSSRRAGSGRADHRGRLAAVGAWALLRRAADHSFHARQIRWQLLPPRMRALPPGARGALYARRQRLPRAHRLHFQIADARLHLQQLQLRVAELFARRTVLLDACHRSRSSRTWILRYAQWSRRFSSTTSGESSGARLGGLGTRDWPKQL